MRVLECILSFILLLIIFPNALNARGAFGVAGLPVKNRVGRLRSQEGRGEGRCASAASRWAVATACRPKPKLLSLLLLVLVLLLFSCPPNFHSPISTSCGTNPPNLGPPGPCRGCRLPHPKSDWPASAAGPRDTWQSGWRHHCPLIRLCALLGYGCTQPRTRNLLSHVLVISAVLRSNLDRIQF